MDPAIHRRLRTGDAITFLFPLKRRSIREFAFTRDGNALHCTGLAGWIMVASGLVTPSVSHVSFNNSFLLALELIGLSFWTALVIKMAP